jgi:hypothetical protein
MKVKVRILSGNNAGAIEDMDQVPAEVAIATGYAERAPEPKAAAVPPPAPPVTKKAAR